MLFAERRQKIIPRYVRYVAPRRKMTPRPQRAGYAARSRHAKHCRPLFRPTPVIRIVDPYLSARAAVSASIILCSFRL